MGFTPISPEFEEDIAEAVNLVQSGDMLSASSLTRWMESSCPELQAIAFNCFRERTTRCESYPIDKRNSFFISFLRRSIEEDCENEFRPRRFDALQYCAILIERECKDKVTLLARQIANLLADVCDTSDQDIRQQVVDVVLEHVLHKENARKCFSFWKSSSILCPLFDEGIELAGKWAELYGKQR